MGELTLHIVTPQGTHGPFICDSIHLTVCDNAEGKGGGSYGIRAGHAGTVLSLDKGEIKAYRSGKEILTAIGSGGFATVDHDTVRAVVEEYHDMSAE